MIGVMTGPDAIQIIDRLGLTQRQFALLAGMHPNSITAWANGGRVSGAAQALLRLLDYRPEDVEVLRALAGVGPGERLRPPGRRSVANRSQMRGHP